METLPRILGLLVVCWIHNGLAQDMAMLNRSVGGRPCLKFARPAVRVITHTDKAPQLTVEQVVATKGVAPLIIHGNATAQNRERQKDFERWAAANPEAYQANLARQAAMAQAVFVQQEMERQAAIVEMQFRAEQLAEMERQQAEVNRHIEAERQAWALEDIATQIGWLDFDIRWR